MRWTIAAVTLLAFLGWQAAGWAGDSDSRLKDLLQKAKRKGAKTATSPAAETPAASEVVAGEIHEDYNINAQYRGTVKKAFMDIGHCAVTFTTKPSGEFNVKVSGSVTDPENESHKYELQIDADYRQQGNRIDLLADRSKFNQEAERHRARVLKDIPFIYIAKFTPYPAVNKDTVWVLDSNEFNIKHTRTDEGGGELQVTITEHGGMIGKIFLETGEAVPHNIKKFRVVGTNDVVLSFVAPRYSAPGK
ncbi:MAG: hypothetical protein HY303_19625 [Candidatus Wallbacteria bacterium]|nr:hypothetical protein [Candidatus Wallbacteria bacterium]